MDEFTGRGERDNWISHFRDHIRRRPSMYVGRLGPLGLHCLAEQLVELSLAEFSSGHAKTVRVRLGTDGSLSVADDGAGIPIDRHAGTNMTTLQWVMTVGNVEVHGGKRVFRSSCHGIGARAVTALSEWAEAEVCRDGRTYRQRYERGLPIGDVCDIGPAGARNGTKITFKPDAEIFDGAAFDHDTLEARLRELAFLNKGLTITLSGERRRKKRTFHYAGGVADFVEYLNRSQDVLHSPPISIDRTLKDVRVEAALQYTRSDQEQVRCYTNNALNVVGGTHQAGFRSALTRTLKAYGRKAGAFKNGVTPIGEDFRAGLTAIVSVHMPEPQFESFNMLRLNNPEIEGTVGKVVREQLSRFLKENPQQARRIVRQAVEATRRRNASLRTRLRNE
jgi:DNA gyrase subunit B